VVSPVIKAPNHCQQNEEENGSGLWTISAFYKLL
jgi:hypothetical protein